MSYIDKLDSARYRPHPYVRVPFTGDGWRIRRATNAARHWPSKLLPLRLKDESK